MLSFFSSCLLRRLVTKRWAHACCVAFPLVADCGYINFHLLGIDKYTYFIYEILGLSFFVLNEICNKIFQGCFLIRKLLNHSLDPMHFHLGDFGPSPWQNHLGVRGEQFVYNFLKRSVSYIFLCIN